MIIIIGLIAAFLLILVFSNRGTRLCRWREDRRGEKTTYHCIYCGATVTGPSGQTPEVCLRDSADPK